MGRKQKAFGDLFEDLFLYHCARIPGLAITRFPDGCRVVGKDKVIRVKTPCDWIVTYGGMTALLDTKTTEGKVFNHSKIDPNQVKEMIKHTQSGAKTGYVIWFRKTDDIVFYSSALLITLLNRRGSLNVPTSGGENYLGKSALFRPKMIFGCN